MATQPITGMLQDFADRDKSALDRLMPLVYSLRLADGHRRNKRTSHTLTSDGAGAQAYIRWIGQDHKSYPSRGHFLAVEAHVMRRILIGHARSTGMFPGRVD
jgi:hypothetical protein